MNKICLVNLSTKSITYETHDYNDSKYYGRSLATYLVEKYTNYSTKRLDNDNAICLVPGLFTGTLAPSTGRISLVTKSGDGQGMQICNMTGEFPQKFASLNYSALVIIGKSNPNNVGIYIDSKEVKIINLDICNKMYVPNIIAHIRSNYGNDCAIIGAGLTSEVLSPLATVFSTYPKGIPEYYCSRRGFGDVWGSKGLKAIIVNNNKCFESYCHDYTNFSLESKKLAKIIINDPICGKALPGYGSITLINLLKDKNKINYDKPSPNVSSNNPISNTVKLNRTCSPLCVIGCLNRHCSDNSKVFSAPAESEVSAALKKCFEIDDPIFAKKINNKAFEICIDSTEFVFTSNIYFKALNITPTYDNIYELLNEVENNTIIGRIIGSKTTGVYELFKYKNEISHLVTKPIINEEKDYKISINKMFQEFNGLNDLELMYNQIFVLENLGFCIFTSFALINNKEAMNIIANMFYYKTGIKIDAIKLIKFAGKCIDNELTYQKENALSSIRKNIPEFTKVLYRYFS